MKPQELIKKIQSGTLDNTFRLLYGTSPETMAVQKQRYIDAVEAFISRFPDRTDVSLFSAPGRSEIGGNHTDHQHGCVLAAAVNLDVIAVVAFHDEE